MMDIVMMQQPRARISHPQITPSKKTVSITVGVPSTAKGAIAWSASTGSSATSHKRRVES